METTNKNTVSTSVVIGVFMLYFMISGNAAATPAIASLSKAFPDVPFATITMVNTLPSITLILGSLFISSTVGKKISFKNAGIIALVFYGFFGVLPTFVHNTFYQILIIRVLYGFGTGLIAPLGAASFLRFIRDYDVRSKYLGFGNAANYIGSFAMTIIGGWLCTAGWTYTFLVYALCFLALAVFLFTYKEPPSIDEILRAEGNTDVSEFEAAKRVKLPPALWAIVIMSVFLGMVTGPYMMNFSSIMDAKIGASPAIAGTLLGIFTVAGAVSAVMMGPWTKIFKRYSGLVGMTLAAIACIITANAMSVAMFTVGILLFGFGYLILLPLIVLESGSLTNSAGAAWAASLYWIGMNIGNFLCSFWDGFMLKVGNGSWSTTYYITAAAVFIIGVVWTIIIGSNPKWKKNAAAAK